MPDFTVIEGGGQPRDWDREVSQRHFEGFVVVLLRSLASGNGAHRPAQEFCRFLEHARERNVPIGPVFDATVRNLYQQAFDRSGDDDYEAETKRILRTALRVTAESMACDNAAAARRSKREDELNHAIENKMVNSERRSRESGWSYLASLGERLGRWPLRRK